MAVNDPLSAPVPSGPPATATPAPVPDPPPVLESEPVPEPALEPDPAAVAALDRAAVELARSTDRGPSPALLPAVMHTVWAELRPGQRIPLPGGAGDLFVTETAAGNALVANIDGLAGMVVRRCSVSYEPAGGDGDRAADGDGDGDGDGAADGGGGRGGIRVALTAAVAYGTDTDTVFANARSIITESADTLFGLTVGAVDIEIVDIYPGPEQPR